MDRRRVSALLPAWVAALAVEPYLRCDGAVYNVSDYPNVAKALGADMATTFNVPDLRKRFRVPADACRVTKSGGDKT